MIGSGQFEVNHHSVSERSTERSRSTQSKSGFHATVLRLRTPVLGRRPRGADGLRELRSPVPHHNIRAGWHGQVQAGTDCFL